MKDLDKIYYTIIIITILFLLFVTYVVIGSYFIKSQTCKNFGGEFNGESYCVKDGIIYELINVKPYSSLFGEYKIGRNAVDLNCEVRTK